MELQSTSTFTYQPLLGDLSTRLIALHPAAEACSQLRCDIIHIDLLDERNFHPPYTALSYAWGTKAKSHVLWCGTSWLPITANLDAALRALRKTSWTLLLWADAACINQNDIHERNSQVANMIYVYSRASSVLVWTGEDDAHQNGAKCLEWLQHLGRHPIMALRSDIRPPEMKLLESFFNRDWFKRRWVVPEAAVAVHAFIICGSKRINWYDFIGGVAALRVRHDIAGDMYHESLAKLCMIEVLNKRWRRIGGTRPTVCEGPSLLQILLQFDASLCSDDRDRVFSLVRLAELDEADLIALSSILDYSLSTEDVYKRLAGILLKQSDYYTLLHFSAAFRPEQLEQSTLPTWVPDWRFHCRFRPMLHSTFNCGLGREGQCCIDDDGSLRIYGCIYDYVSSGSQQLLPSGDLGEVLRTLVERDIAEEIDALRTNDDPRLCVARERFQGPLNNIANLLTADRTLDAIAHEVKASPSEHARQPFERSVGVKTLRGRKLFKTVGTGVGIGPSDVKESDVVAIFYGVRTPFIIREDSVRYGWYIIGDAYVSAITKKAIRERNVFTREFRII